MTSILSARARRLGDVLAAWPRRRIRLDELWKVLDEIEPTTRTDSRRRRILAGLITELAAVGELELPAARSYDHTEMPALPRFLSLRRETAALETPRRPIVWHPSLSWVPASRLAPSQLERLERVNDWLQVNRDPLVVPSRERSVEIFEDEKALDRLIGGALFIPGRLSLELLRCHRVVPRLHCEPVGEGSVLLVVENSDTFGSLVTVLRQRNNHRIGLVGWGAGTGFEASVLSIADLGRAITQISYFGDLDENGLRIPANASLIAEGAGLPLVRPAAGLYRAMLSQGKPQPGQRKVPVDTSVSLVAWLDPVHREEAGRLLSSGLRLAQEWVGLSHLSRSDDWLRDIREITKLVVRGRLSAPANHDHLSVSGGWGGSPIEIPERSPVVIVGWVVRRLAASSAPVSSSSPRRAASANAPSVRPPANLLDNLRGVARLCCQETLQVTPWGLRVI